MAVFVCPDIHELSLVSMFKKNKRPRNSVLSLASICEKIETFLVHKTVPVTPEMVLLIIQVFEDIGFIFKIPLLNDNIALNNLTQSYLIPAMRPVGRFIWTYEAGSHLLTAGRRISHLNSDPILPSWFCDLQVCCYCHLFLLHCFHLYQIFTFLGSFFEGV
jgi:hypothetical protein